MSRDVKERRSGNDDVALLSGVDVRQLYEQAKLDEVAVVLCSLMEHAQLSRVELARRLNWTPSRVTKVLSGEDNLTLKTLVRLLSELGYDFDVVLRRVGAPRARQPWDRKGLVLVFDGAAAFREGRGKAPTLFEEEYRFSAVLKESAVCANDASMKDHESVAA